MEHKTVYAREARLHNNNKLQEVSENRWDTRTTHVDATHVRSRPPASVTELYSTIQSLVRVIDYT